MVDAVSNLCSENGVGVMENWEIFAFALGLSDSTSLVALDVSLFGNATIDLPSHHRSCHIFFAKIREEHQKNELLCSLFKCSFLTGT